MDFNRIDPERTGKFIAALRKAHNLTQDQLGEKLFITRKAVSKWETGRACPSIDMLKLLSETLGVSLEDIIEGDFNKLEALLNNDNVVYKTVHSKAFKWSWIILWIIVSLMLFTFFILNFNATKMYSVYSTNEMYSIDDVVVVISRVRSYVSFGKFYSNKDRNEDDSLYRYELYLKDGDSERSILKCGANRIVDIPNDVKNVISDALLRNSENLFLRITKIDSKENIDLKLSIRKKIDFTKNPEDPLEFARAVLGKYNDNVLQTNYLDSKERFLSEFGKSENSEIEKVESVDLSFLYDLDFDEIKKKYDKKSLYIDNERYLLSFNDESKSLLVKHGDKYAEFALLLHSVKLHNGISYSINYDSTILFNNYDYKFESNLFLINIIDNIIKL